MNYKKYHRDKTYQENEGHFRNIFMTRFAIAKCLIQKPGRVLDIGASTGVMLDIFKENGFETWGVEPSVSALRAMEKKHKILKTYFEKANLPKNYFDLVIMNHTLEHLDDPVLILEKIYKILRKNGIVLIDVPNAGGLGSKIWGNNWPYRLPAEHKQQFTRESLSKVFKEAGFEIIYFKSRSGIFELSNPVKDIWESLIHLKKRFFTTILNIPYDVLVTALNMGDSMSMVGRKV